MSLEDFNQDYSPVETGGGEEKEPKSCRRARTIVSVIVEGGIPPFYDKFLRREGIPATRETYSRELGQHRISAARSNRVRLLRILRHMKGVSIVEESEAEVA